MMTAPDQAFRGSLSAVHAAARSAWFAGLSAVPTAIDGSKKPLGGWKQYQASRPTLEQIDTWFANGHPGFGVICGSVSGGLEMLELEGRAMAEGMWDDFCARCDAAGIGDVLDLIANSYAEETPSGGIHLLFKVSGANLGNTKLARRPDGTEIQVLFETRGEGGFVVLAPSSGPVHPSGKPWELLEGGFVSLPTITEVERDALYDVARSFDAMPERVLQMPRHPDLLPYTTAPGESWFDAVVSDLARTSWGDILGKYGLHHHHDSGEITYWTRPGKDTKDGYSATTNAKGTDRLIVFTSAMPLDEWSGSGPAPSYDRLDVIAAYDHRGDRVEAARSLRTPSSRLRPANVSSNGEIEGHLPEEFWSARPVLAHIRQAAHSRARSGDAYFGAVLARLAALTHPSIKLPALAGSVAPLSLFVAQVGKSGGGKSSTVSGASELLPYDGLEVADNMPLGSGEGLIELYYDLVDEIGNDGKTRKVKKQTRWGAFVYLDEGQALAEMGSRKGSTLLPMLRTAWSGVVLGTSNASAETKRRLPPGSYTLGLVIAFQPSKAAELLADGAGGTPQRFEWVQDIDPTLPEEEVQWPGPLPWVHPSLRGYLSVTQPTIIDVPRSIAEPIKKEARLITRGELQREELNSHATLARLKVAGLLGVLDGRTNMTEDDWELAGIFQKVSHRVRANVMAAVEIEQRQKEDFAIARHVSREGAVAEDQAQRAAHRMARAIGRHVHRAECEGGCNQRCVARSTASRDRAVATVDDALERARELKWIKGDNGIILPGEARPT